MTMTMIRTLHFYTLFIFLSSSSLFHRLIRRLTISVSLSTEGGRNLHSKRTGSRKEEPIRVYGHVGGEKTIHKNSKRISIVTYGSSRSFLFIVPSSFSFFSLFLVPSSSSSSFFSLFLVSSSSSFADGQ